MSKRTTYVPTLVAKPANLLCLILGSISKPTWWKSMVLRCLRVIKRTRAALTQPLNFKMLLQTPTGAVAEGQVAPAEGGVNGSSATLSHK